MKRSSSRDPETIVQRQLNAYNKRDINAFINCFSPDIEAFILPQGRPAIAGREEFKNRYERLFKENPQLNCEIQSRIIRDPFIIDKEFITGLSRAPQGVHAVSIYHVENGIIQKVWFIK